MSELRQNLATREWVVIAPERGEKPSSIKSRIAKEAISDKEYEPNCPFCPGNEERFSEVENFRIDDSKGNWQVKAVDNKYKILDAYEGCPIVSEPFEDDGIYKKLKGCGSHELIIENSRHSKTIVDMDEDEIKNIILAFIDRYRAFKKNPNNLITIIFKNYGAMAGQSQIHSHSQIVGSRVVPLYIRSLLREAERYFDDNGTCVFCDILEYEIEEKKRVVYQNEDYVIFVPYAAGSEHETWIMPRFHSSGMDALTGKRIDNLANALQTILRKFNLAIDNPDFNFVIRNAPYPMSSVPFYHCHIQLLPRIKILGGFERGTRIQVNTILPEVSARMLRECKAC